MKIGKSNINNKTTLSDVKLFKLKAMTDTGGSLIPVESQKDIPFPIKRVFYVYDVDSLDNRGQHSHYKTKQVLVCIKGKIEVICDDGVVREKYILNSPNEAIYIPEMIWDEQVYFSKDTIMLALANTLYDRNDYIENYEEFTELKTGTHENN